jgi:small subunit ribosomal protein S14
LAKQRNIVKNARRQGIVAGYAERRAELKRVIANPARTDDRRETTGAP